MDIQEVIKASKDLGEWAHIATVSKSGIPYVTPVHPCWEGKVLWIMVGANSVKSKNIAHFPSVSLHWQVSQETGFDSLMIWGQAELFTDIDTKKRLWSGVFDYDLNVFAPNGPENSPETGFISVNPTKAVILKEMGIGERLVWRSE
ncbi:MAG: hypothetical protein CL453_03445 [Acidimicrobiaceae bacterium]|nr:hypothetical protein [Acidimicrobiaceae bacterium]|tara:strand:- start:8431 stop:8868 length:438 start_codon:yes stop_codon:yes gene_type:complete